MGSARRLNLSCADGREVVHGYDDDLDLRS